MSRALIEVAPSVVVVGRAACALGLGALIGLDRELNGQPAGMRTHAMVAVGSTLFALAGAAVSMADPTRVAAQIVSGIGFLGAGAIVRDTGRIRGLTTAASLWATAAVGLAVGFGQLVTAVIFTVACLAVLAIPKRLPQRMLARQVRTVVVVTDAGADLGELRESLRATGRARTTSVETLPDGRHRVCISVDGRHDDPLDTAEQLLAVPEVVAIEVR